MPRGPKPQSLALTKKQQKIFDAHAYLTFWAANRYRYSHIGADRDEVLQACRIGLTRAILKNDSLREMSFTTWCIQMMLWECGKQLFGCCQGVAATNAARKYEVSGDAPVTTKDGEIATRMTLAENKAGKREMQSDIGALNAASLKYEILDTIKHLATLSADEKKLLKLKYVTGLGKLQLAERFDVSPAAIVRRLRVAIAKLRIHFRDFGALAPDAPIPASGGKTNSRNRCVAAEKSRSRVELK
jgi:RNA polymerase sigma factor (sigma-70 family)